MHSSRCAHRPNSRSPALPRRPPSPKLRFDAYVCTAAERGYALEAWRVLDPDGWMIPLDQREKGESSGVERAPAECPLLCTCAMRPAVPLRVLLFVLLLRLSALLHPLCAGNKRVTSGSKIKSLSNVLGLGRVPPPGPGGRAASHMPLAIIVDDRVEVRRCTDWLAGATTSALAWCACKPSQRTPSSSYGQLSGLAVHHQSATRQPFMWPLPSPSPLPRCGTRTAGARCCRWSLSGPGRSRRRMTAACRARPPCRWAGNAGRRGAMQAAVAIDRVHTCNAVRRVAVLSVHYIQQRGPQPLACKFASASVSERPRATLPQSLMAQMVRLQSELFNLRMHAFHRIQEVLR